MFPGIDVANAALSPAEDEDVAVRIADFELPVSIRLLLQWRSDKIPTPHRLPEGMYTIHPDIGVPYSLRSLRREVGLLIAFQAEQHDLGAIPLQARIGVRFVGGKRAGGAETEVLGVPAGGAAYVIDQE